MADRPKRARAKAAPKADDPPKGEQRGGTGRRRGKGDEGKPFKKAFAARLRELREKAGYKTVASAAKALGVHRVTVNQLEIGSRSPSAETVQDIVDVLGIDPADLFPRTPGRRVPPNQVSD
jgi:DNA-binding XRE family transcriptional regulator